MKDDYYRYKATVLQGLLYASYQCEVSMARSLLAYRLLALVGWLMTLGLLVWGVPV